MSSKEPELSKQCEDYCKPYQEGFRFVDCPQQCINYKYGPPCNNTEFNACIDACGSCKVDCTKKAFGKAHIQWTCPKIPEKVKEAAEINYWTSVPVYGVYAIIILIILAQVLLYILKKRAERKNRAQRWGAPGVIPPQLPLLAGDGMMQAPPPNMMMPQVTSPIERAPSSQAQLYPTV